MQSIQRWSLLLVLLLMGLGADAAEPAAEPQTFEGKVLPTARAMTLLGIKADKDSPGVVLVTEDKRVYSINKDENSRLLFLDPRLQDRTLRITARMIPGTQCLALTAVRTLKDGKPHEVFYWCEECQLRWTEPGACKCCGGETELIELPLKVQTK